MKKAITRYAIKMAKIAEPDTECKTLKKALQILRRSWDYEHTLVINDLDRYNIRY